MINSIKKANYIGKDLNFKIKNTDQWNETNNNFKGNLQNHFQGENRLKKNQKFVKISRCFLSTRYF
jgi:hypothetical protein